MRAGALHLFSALHFFSENNEDHRWPVRKVSRIDNATKMKKNQHFIASATCDVRLLSNLNQNLLLSDTYGHRLEFFQVHKLEQRLHSLEIPITTNLQSWLRSMILERRRAEPLSLQLD